MVEMWLSCFLSRANTIMVMYRIIHNHNYVRHLTCNKYVSTSIEIDEFKIPNVALA